jgi:hypothetical protein
VARFNGRHNIINEHHAAQSTAVEIRRHYLWIAVIYPSAARPFTEGAFRERKEHVARVGDVGGLVRLDRLPGKPGKMQSVGPCRPMLLVTSVAVASSSLRRVAFALLGKHSTWTHVGHMHVN